MSNLVKRDADDVDYLFAVWYGELGHGAQVECGARETLVFCDDGSHALATVGPGRTALTPEAFPPLAKYLERHLLSASPTLMGFFITLAPQELEEVEVECGLVRGPDGIARSVTAWALVTYQVEKPELFAEAMSRAEEGEGESTDAEEDEDEVEEDEAEGGDTIEDPDPEDAAEEEEPDAVEVALRHALRTAVATVMVKDPPPDAELNTTVCGRLPELMNPELALIGIKVLSSGEVIVSRDGDPVV